MPVTRRSRAQFRAVLGLSALALVLSACAPGGGPPSFPVAFGGQSFVTQVVASVNDVGRSPSIAFDAKTGAVAVSYLLGRPKLAPGAIPPPVIANTPQPPSVVLSSLSGGVWSSYAVTGTKKQPTVGLATMIADAKGQVLPNVTTALAVDGKGVHHVIWSTPSGLFYAADAPVQAGGATAFAFSGTWQRIAKGPAIGGSIAVDASGTPWVAWDDGGAIMVATQAADGKWRTSPVAGIRPLGAMLQRPTSPPIRTGIVVPDRPGDRVTVVYPDPVTGRPMAAMDSAASMADAVAGSWTVAPILREPGSGGFGMSLTTSPSSGQPVAAFYTRDGGVDVAAWSGAKWSASTVSPAAGTPAGDTSGWSTGVGVDSSGRTYVAYAAPGRGGGVMFSSASDSGGPFPKPVEVVGSQRGESPSLAVTPDGKHLAIAWFDAANLHLNVAMPSTGAAQALAVPSPSFSPLPTPAAPGQLPCTPTGTTLSVSAQNLAFNTNCLAAPANTPFKIVFDNKDSGVPHNVAIYSNSSATDLIGGAKSPSDTIVGPGTATYTISGLPPGIYYFRCDVHPTTMYGTFVVAKRK